MKFQPSVRDLILPFACVALLGCSSDETASVDSPQGIWLTEIAAQDGLPHSRQLLVVEALTDGAFRIHECALTGSQSPLLERVEYHNGALHAAQSYTDFAHAEPYIETESLHLSLMGHRLQGEYISTDRNLDGSFRDDMALQIDARRVSYAGSLSALSEQEIIQMLGGLPDPSPVSPVLGDTCASLVQRHTVSGQMALEMVREERAPTAVASAAE